MKLRKKILSNEVGLAINQFFINAYSDYISARILFLNDRLRDACYFANTAIEKYIKGLLLLQGDRPPRHHDLTALSMLNPLKNKYKNFYNSLDIEFLTLLSSAYKMRYLDDIEVGFNIAIIKRKTLAELDRIVTYIEENTMILVSGKNGTVKQYTFDKDSKNPALWQGNIFLHKIEQRSFVDQDNRVYEARKLRNGEMMEVMYTTHEPVFDKPFIMEALNEKNPQTFTLTCVRIDETDIGGANPHKKMKDN